jgi:hypothetical protein
VHQKWNDVTGKIHKIPGNNSSSSIFSRKYWKTHIPMIYATTLSLATGTIVRKCHWNVKPTNMRARRMFWEQCLRRRNIFFSFFKHFCLPSSDTHWWGCIRKFDLCLFCLIRFSTPCFDSEDDERTKNDGCSEIRIRRKSNARAWKVCIFRLNSNSKAKNEENKI